MQQQEEEGELDCLSPSSLFCVARCHACKRKENTRVCFGLDRIFLGKRKERDRRKAF